MADKTDNVFNKEKQKPKVLENVWYKSVRLTINLLIHILIFFTVFVCLFYACSSSVTRFDWHIILCVLGIDEIGDLGTAAFTVAQLNSTNIFEIYPHVADCGGKNVATELRQFFPNTPLVKYQFFMCQGILMMSPYNSLSMFMARRYKKHTHWVMQVVAVALVTAGTALIIQQKSVHFTSIHGKLGLAALVCCLASLLNGILAMYPTKLSSCICVFWIRFFHYVTGLASMFLAAGSLCAAFKYRSFRTWTGNGDVFVPTLIGLTWIFTILVSLDFWIIIGNKVRNLIK